MLDLDGSDGGGQLVRSALTCSLLTGEGFDLSGIRGDRPNPGLRPQHLAAVELATDIGDATVTGDAIESGHLTFEPGAVSPGGYAVDVGTAGSLTLLCDVVVPLAAHLDSQLDLTLDGGTDVKWSPPTDFHRHVKLPLLRSAGWDVTLAVERRGFYPAGGGRIELSLSPCDPSPLQLTDRGASEHAHVFAVESEHLADAEVADRLATAAEEGLASEWSVESSTETVASDSPGAVVVVRLDYEGGVAGVSALGEKGVPAEDVAEQAVDAVRAFDVGTGAVDAHLADQLVLPVALAGGTVRIPEVTDHVATNVDLLQAFGFDVTLDEREADAVLSAPVP
ncbi:RNA 3'-terminal phosphate cyclase [Halorarius litoreus]|uniref:RNA 3'-terminal phosphate cyclase n=1 Tax=Halorarius litoreus TaxID=2962676 RepID=UPI0020CF4A9A|nr:RNA 3'-terminal phosphate cyclase [Halorarius litoreus]